MTWKARVRARHVQARIIPGRYAFGVNIIQDRQDPARYAIYINQAGLILPGPEYYTDPQFNDVKATYQAAVAKILHQIAWPDADNKAKQIVDLETRVAAVSSSHGRAERCRQDLSQDYPERARHLGARI